MKALLSPKQLALAIGVSESSLKRWVDDGLIHATRTAGGHRRIPIAEAVRFVRDSGSPLVRPDVLGLPEAPAVDQSSGTGDRDAERLFAYLSAGQAAEARGLVISLYLTGHSVAEILDGPVREAMEQLGRLWRHGEEGIVREHRATDICIQAITQLRLILPAADGAAVALGGAPPGDPYVIPSLAAATVLAAEGFKAINLGPNTPFEALHRAAREQSPRLVWLTISHVHDAENAARGVAALAEELGKLDIRLVIGGSARGAVALPRRPNVYVGARLGELAAFARGLRAAVKPDQPAPGAN